MNLTFDPNWFYSSIAQCSSAIIALLGAIIATKLQSQLIETETEYRALYHHFATFASQLQNAIDKTAQSEVNLALPKQ